ncbi:unnamed protein product [Trichobilharzia szidati]|nr:unnamed protein product [Trichobilharzia szidati]
MVVNTTNKKSTTSDDKRHSQEKPVNTTRHKSNKYSSLQDAVEKLDLNHLSEEERNKVLDVIKKDFEVRAKEQERLNRFRCSIIRRDKELAAKSISMAVESTSCIICGRPFMALINPKRICGNCRRTICRNCSDTVPKYNDFFCTMCLKETGYRAMTCTWFYDTVIQRFREFGSTTVAKSLFGSKYKQVQNMAEDELWNLLLRRPSSKRTSLEPSGVCTPDQAKEAQINKLRSRLEKLMEETRCELMAIDQNIALSPRQINWQYESVCQKFKKNACKEMKNFIQILYITTEKQRMSQGMNTKHITSYVMDVLEGEISRIVGYSVKGLTDTTSWVGEDDKESISMVDSEKVEERLADVLLNKIFPITPSSVVGNKFFPSEVNNIPYTTPTANNTITTTTTTIATTAATAVAAASNMNDGKFDDFVNTSSNNKKEELSVTEGFPIRMEYYLPYEEKCEFRWYKLTHENQRIPVKLDFRTEHVITAATSKSIRQYPFVLSNSGFITSETKQKLNQLNREISETMINKNDADRSKAKNMIQLQHHLIIWASKLDDAGHYYAAVQYPLDKNGTSAIQEKDYLLQVLKPNLSPPEAQSKPAFVEPLTVQPINCGNNDPYIEMTCVVTGNPSPRCLFYRNSVPIPIVMMPLNKINQEEEAISAMSSFSQKYTVTSSLCRPSNETNRPGGCVRKITLRINRPSSSEDIATYSCRAWNCHGRTTTTTDLSVEDHFSKFDCPPGKATLFERLNMANIESANLAANISQTAREHGDFLTQKEGAPRTTPRSQLHDRTPESAKRSEQNNLSATNETSIRNKSLENMKTLDTAKTINHIQGKVNEAYSATSSSPLPPLPPPQQRQQQQQQLSQPPQTTSKRNVPEIIREYDRKHVSDAIDNHQSIHFPKAVKNDSLPPPAPQPLPSPSALSPSSSPSPRRTITITREEKSSRPQQQQQHQPQHQPSQLTTHLEDTDERSISSSVSINDAQFKRRTSGKSTGPNILIDRRSNRMNRRNSSSSNITDS